MKRQLATALVILVVLLLGALPATQAALQQAGPVNTTPSVGGYPAWYQDTTGLALEFCDPKNQAEVDGGWCLLLPGDPPVVPEVFPALFFDEHFWFAADASLTAANGGQALLVLALEAAFANAVQPGDQMAFSRIRFKLTNAPAPGTYRFIHPYGEDAVTCPAECRGVASDLIFVTDDVGLTPLNFTEALNSRLGPFLLPAVAPGGPELAAVPGPVLGKLYIADPGRLGPVTGSPLPPFMACPSSAPCDLTTGGVLRNHNLFRIEGPAGSGLGGPGVDVLETTDFALVGRIFTGPIAGKLTVDRASYARSATASTVDVYATAFPSSQGRLPAGLPPATVPTALAYFNAPCTATLDATGAPGPPFSAPAGVSATQMMANGSHYFAESHPATIPPEVCLQANAVNAAGQTVTTFIPTLLADQVVITEALFDPASNNLSVKATSSDQVVPQTLTVVGFGDLDPATGQLLVPGLFAPPERVTVRSSALGVTDRQMSTGPVAGGGGGGPVALNDTATTPEDTAVTIDVLGNDTNASGGTVTIAIPPLLGGVVINPDNTVTYTPNLNAIGVDSFMYRVTVGAQISNVANVAVTITNVNDPPTATNDTATAIANLATAINVLANDTDPDGQADLAAVASLTQPTPAGASVVLNGTAVSFTATAAGTYTFTYQAQDAGGLLSNVATVTVTVAGAETITVTRAELRANTRLRVDGTIAPASGQTLTVQFAANNQAIAGTAAFTVVTDAAGFWTVDARNITAPGSATQVKVTSSNGTVQFAPLLRR